MILAFHPQASEYYLHWQKKDRILLKKNNHLIRDIQRDPFDGIAYRIKGDELIIAQCRGHD